MSGSNGQRPATKKRTKKRQRDERWQKATDAKPSKLRWLLPQRIIAGGLTIVEGDTSVGKTTFLAHLVASITTGSPWLGRPKSDPGKVLWMTGEEDFARDVLPRLAAAKADSSLVMIPSQDEHDEPRRLIIPDAIDEIRETIQTYGITLVICEPLSSFVSPTVNLNDTVSVRCCLDPLQRMSIATGASVIITRGLRKDRSGPRTSHGQGSAAIGDTARSVLCIETADGNENKRLLRVVKCSRSPRTPTLSYLLMKSNIGPVMTELEELNPIEEADSDNVADAAERGARADARRMIQTMLAEGWVRSSVMKSAAEDAMISINTLRRASKELGVQTRQKWDTASSYHEWGPPEGGFNAPPPTP